MKFALLFMAFLSLPTFASQKIERILEVNDLKENHLSLFMSDGEILHIKSDDYEMIELSREALKGSYLVEIAKESDTENKAAIVTDLEILPLTPIAASALTHVSEEVVTSADLSIELKNFTPDPLEHANMTNFETYGDAQKVMDTFNSDTHKDSQCYNRAHVWTYEALVNESATLGKVWIFFTKKYIRDYQYKWWFHIAPTAKVQEFTYIVDRGFTTIPYNPTNWKNIFIKSKEECTTTTDYLEYEANPENGHCYLIYSSQHYYQPQHLRQLITDGRVPKDYYYSDIKNAYRDALNNWDGRIPGVQSEGDNFTFKLGESVISRNGVIGKVVRLRGDELLVKYETMARPILQHKGEVGMRRGGAGGFSVGEEVKSRSRNRNRKGQVVAVYMDGFLGVYYKRNKSYAIEHPTNLKRR